MKFISKSFQYQEHHNTRIMEEIYCLKCRKHTANKEKPEEHEILGRPVLKAICAVCGVKKGRFVKKSKDVVHSPGCYSMHCHRYLKNLIQ